MSFLNKSTVLATFLIVVFFSFSYYSIHARSVTLTKTGGGGLIYTSTTIPSQYPPTTPIADFINPSFPSLNVMSFTEPTPMNPSKNWTEEFNLISDAINNDPERDLASVEYLIEIDADNPNAPLIIGRQFADPGYYFLKGRAVIELGNKDQPLIRIHKVSINSGSNATAYFKFEDNLFYGSWLPPLYTFYYYKYDYDTNDDPVLINNQVRFSTLPRGSGTPSNPISNVNYLSHSNGSNPVSINDISVTGTLNPFWSNVNDLNIKCSAGFFINSLYCDNLTCENLRLDGNGRNCKLGGNFGDVGIQAYYTGINLHSCKDAVITNCHMNECGFDGITIDGSATEDITVTSCHFNGNGRNGMAWKEGKHLTVTECQFNNTGKTVNASTNDYLASSPGASLDIEPNSGGLCENGVFDQCDFKNPIGQCVVCNSYPLNADNILFSNKCVFEKPDDEFGVLVRGRRFTFNDCDIHCVIRNAYNGTVASDALQFLNCRIEDLPTWPTVNRKLLDIEGARYALFQQCTLNVYTLNRELFNLNFATSVAAESEYTTFEDCTFNYLNPGNPNGSPSEMRYVRFTEQNVINSNSSSSCDWHGIFLHQSILEGSTTCPGAASTLALNGMVELVLDMPSSIQPIRLGGGSGKAKLIVGSKSLLKVIPGTYIHIDANSSLEIQDGGSIFCGGEYTLNGRFIAYDHSYVCLNANPTFSGSGSLFLSLLINDGGVYGHPVWTNCTGTNFAGPWINGNNINCCVVGGNSSIPTTGTTPTVCFNPDYLHCSSDGAYTVYYNVEHVSCNSALDGKISIQMNGGVSPFEYSLNSGAFSPLINSINVGAGSYLVRVKDAIGCSNSISITITEPTPVSVIAIFTNVSCNGAADGTITATGSPGSIITINGAPPAANYGPGVYTVVATAPGGNTGQTCTATTTVTISEPTVVSVNASFTNVSCNGAADGTITATGSPGTTITINGAPPVANYGPGVYTVVATAPGGNAGQTCTAITTVTITEPITVSLNATFTNVSCNGAADGTITATGSPGSTITINGALPAANYGPGVYTVIATAVGGNAGQTCTATTTVTIGTDWVNYCCNSEYAVASAPKEHMEGIPYDYAISTHVPAMATYTGYTFFVHNNLVIDQSTTFNNCTFFFTPNSKITVASGQSLTLAACTLKAGCNAMWDGIYASDAGSEVIINGGILQDMENGVVIANLGKLTSDQTHFNSNYIGIQLNRLPSTYNGSIQRCTFDTPGPLLAPHDAQINGEHGIRVSDCQSITIGHASNANKRNNFQHLYNGIYILNTRPNPLPLNPLQEVTIHCEYNTFSNIEGGAALWSNATNNGPQFYQDHRGCAIFGMNEWMPYPIKLFYKGNNNASFYDYLNCQKAILVNSFSTDVQFVKAEHIDGGMLHYACDYHKQMVTNNSLNNTYLGVLVQGNTGGGFVNNNSMTLLAHPETSPSGSPLYWGKGIELSYFNNEAVNPVEVKNNTISSAASDWILGLSFLNCPYGTRKENLILFSTISNVLNPYPYPVLRGIQAISGKNNIFEKNTVTGAYNYDALSYRRSVGIYMERNSRNTYNCNVNDYVYYGAYVLGNNAGNFDQFNRNTFRSSRYGILLRHLVDNGTLGDIGNQAIYDANNQFYDQSIAGVNNNKRVHRITTPSLCTDPNANQSTIFTSSNNLIQIHSTSNMPNSIDCRYLVFNDPTYDFTYQCTPGTLEVNEEPGDEILDIALAEDIAEDSVVYSEYAEVGKWMDELELYAQLDHDDSVRLTHPVLDSFYLSRRQSNVDKIYRIDRLLGELSDSSIYSSPALLDEKLSQAMALNDSLVLGDYFVNNEHWINSQLFNSIMNGVQSLHSDVRQQISDLSNECPYQAGKAVFKARTLNSMLNPMSNYDDLQICSTAGVYKTAGGKGLFDEENQQLDSMAKQDGLQLIFAKEKTGIKIYPNPAQDKIIIKYQLISNENGVLVLYDISGREQLRIQLSSLSTIVETFVSNLNDGVYSYKYMVNGKTFETGKLTILK